MKIKYFRNGEQEIPLLDSAPAGKRLAAHYNGNNFYAPLVATTAANASPLRVCSGNENFAVGAGSSKQTAILSFSGIASYYDGSYTSSSGRGEAWVIPASNSPVTMTYNGDADISSFSCTLPGFVEASLRLTEFNSSTGKVGFIFSKGLTAGKESITYSFTVTAPETDNFTAATATFTVEIKAKGGKDK